MGLIFRSAIIVAGIAIMSPVHQDNAPARPSATIEQAARPSEEVHRSLSQHMEDAARDAAPALAQALWTAIGPADREALGRVVLDVLSEPTRPAPARPGRMPQG